MSLVKCGNEEDQEFSIWINRNQRWWKRDIWPENRPGSDPWQWRTGYVLPSSFRLLVSGGRSMRTRVTRPLVRSLRALAVQSSIAAWWGYRFDG